MSEVIQILDVNGKLDRKNNIQLHKIEKKYIDDLDNNLKELLEMSSIISITDKEFAGEGKLVDRVGEYYKSIGGKVEREEIGEVLFNRHTIKDTKYHLKTESKEKTNIIISAFKIIPDIIKKGVIINKELEWKGENYNTYLIVAPITIIDNGDYIVEVIIKENIISNKKQVYLHKVNEIEIINEWFSHTMKNEFFTDREPPINSSLIDFYKNVKYFISNGEKYDK